MAIIADRIKYLIKNKTDKFKNIINWLRLPRADNQYINSLELLL
jgi:hypothetical protein